MKAPEQFMQNMQTLLGEDYQAYAASFLMPSLRGLRLNPQRKIPDLKSLSFLDEKIPFAEYGYYLKPDSQPAKHPYYAAGVYYLQEPSAMLPADRLPIEEGDLVLDLCAAPGGKSTQILGKLKGSGLLLSNDISAGRAKILLKNLVLSGNRNFFVSAEEPRTLADTYGPIFDKILVDAPCSGEGMFRRDESLIRDWEQKGPAYYAPIQKEILSCAYDMLKPGGMLLYSTCTFAASENEDNILWLIKEHPDLHPVQIRCTDGMSPGLSGLTEAARCFPHRMKGEGHFLCLLQKEPDGNEHLGGIPAKPLKCVKKLPEQVQKVLDKIREPFDPDRICMINDELYDFPQGSEKIYHPRLRFLRTGLHLGTIAGNNRFKPSQALALTLSADDFYNVVDLPLEDERVLRYLRGETIFAEAAEGPEENGTVLVCVDGYALGFAKAENGKMKNGLHPGYIWH